MGDSSRVALLVGLIIGLPYMPFGDLTTRCGRASVQKEGGIWVDPTTNLCDRYKTYID